MIAAESSHKVGVEASGKEAMSDFRGGRPDLVILDLTLPDLGGLEIIARLKIIDPEARILVLSMHDDHIHVTRALQAVAAGYVSQTIPPEELLEAIGRASRGRPSLPHADGGELPRSRTRTPPPPHDNP